MILLGSMLGGVVLLATPWIFRNTSRRTLRLIAIAAAALSRRDDRLRRKDLSPLQRMTMPLLFPSIAAGRGIAPAALAASAPRALSLSGVPGANRQTKSGARSTAPCATRNSDGPEGTAPGQIGHLNAAGDGTSRPRPRGASTRRPVDSPILNAFGNHIINSLGKTKFLELRVAPAQLADALPQDSDLDHDGIPDARELRDGTHPLNRNDGNPWLLFQHNFRENFGQIVLTLAATCAGIYGLVHLLNGFANAMRLKREDGDEASH